MAPSTWVVIGASRGLGLELVRQLLDQGNQVIAAVRTPSTANEIWQLSAKQPRPAACLIEQCDVTSEVSIDAFVMSMKKLVDKGIRIENIVLNAGILKNQKGTTEISFGEFALHLHTNTIGPIIIAQKLLKISGIAPPSKIIFISSDSGSTTLFREYEDGFGAYGASKAALNQMLRHMAAELKRKGGKYAEVCVLAVHPGEVQTDMANIDVDWDVEGIITPEESVTKMLQVFAKKGKDDSGTFWCWDGREHPW